jgi:hypothetical protein
MAPRLSERPLRPAFSEKSHAPTGRATIKASIYNENVRTSIELKPDHRARLADLAARKGARGFSSIIAEALDAYLGSEPRQTETVSITTLATTGLKLRRDIPIVIERVDDGFVATFFDANLSMSGDTQEEAFRNVRELIVDIFNDLDSEPADRLGPGPRMQIQVLRSFIVPVPA